MRGDFVALDLETTGLDPKLDAIIEFGAVRFRDGEVIAEYSTLINPGRPIPPEITTLTGISNEDFLAKLHKPGELPHPAAPSLAQALSAIQTFVGNAPIIGHNVGFDLNFLYPHGLFQNNLWIDTYDLAAVMMPGATRYSLSSLARQLNIELTEAHRALNDARASALLYWAMWQKILKLPPALNHEIINLSQGVDWNARTVFEYALEQQRATKSTTQPDTQDSIVTIPLFNQEVAASTGTTERSTENIESVFGDSGSLAEVISHYESRPEQVDMARKVNEAFNQNNHLIVEAGTGIGKSLAYLVPAILWAANNQSRVVISTNTLNLQDQLLANDIPLLKQALTTPFEAAILKGRSNYLCPSRLTDMRRRRPSTTDELRVMAKVLVWLTEGGSGEKSELNLRAFIEQSAWQRLSAEAESCSLERCEAATQGKCPFYRARKAAEAAQVVIVNHALLLADAVSDNQVIPDYDHLVIDEAHHLEEAITTSLSVRIDETAFKYRLGHLAVNKHSLLSELINNLQTHVPPQDSKRLIDFMGNFRSATVAIETHIANLFSAFRNLAYKPDADNTIILRITAEIRRKAEFSALERQWNIVKEFLTAIADGLQKLIPALNRLKSYPVPNLQDDIASLDAFSHYFTTILDTMDALISKPDDGTIYWIHLNQSYGVSINTAPLRVGNLVDQYIWSAKRSTILTSATLQATGNFNYIQKILNAETVETLALNSPFNYRESTLVFIPNDMPDPNDRGRYQQAVERALVEVAAALEGRTLALFTSYTQLQQTAQAIRPRLALGDITVYDQLDTSNRQALLESFKTTEKAILLGTKSFWEGIDIPGASLSALALAKLPFPIPTDPIISARSETFNDPFKEYTLPETILRFRQGFGRLIRKQSDRGVVVLLDRRLMSKSYGQDFLDSLPDCTIQYGALESLGAAAQKWIKMDS
ncbi:MAG: DEAD/DEAH box helicase family protein [Anaerolineae bacterium]|nr:DEAD/DEAH box helicase family protein [Anaerolineae bacterium]